MEDDVLGGLNLEGGGGIKGFRKMEGRGSDGSIQNFRIIFENGDVRRVGLHEGQFIEILKDQGCVLSEPDSSGTIWVTKGSDE